MRKKRYGKINYCGGQAIMILVILVLFLSIILVSGFSALALGGSSVSNSLLNSKKSLFLAEAATEDLVYRLSNGMLYSNTEILELGGFVATTTVADNASGEKEIIAESTFSKAVRKIKTTLTVGVGISFNYGVQIGEGGLLMKNSSLVTGNVYSNGPIVGENTNLVKGDVISAGPTGSVDGVHATGTVYAHNILASAIEGDAYYTTIDFATTVGGTLYPGSTDQPFADMPISEEIIDGWKALAESGGVINSPCPYELDSDVAIGPIKINCDLEITGDPVVTLNGPIWVVGDILVKNTAILRLGASYGNKGLAIIADDPSDRFNSGKIELANSVEFDDAGIGGYVLLVSMNNSASNGGSDRAIEIKNTVNGDFLIYAPYGEIAMLNSGDIREVTGYKVRLSNTANVIYEIGLANLLFDAGPGGAWEINKWEEL